jgi:hypothetical protein
MRVFTPVSAIIWRKEGGPPLPPRSIVNVLAATAMGANLVDDPIEQETEFTLAKVPEQGSIPKVITTTISTTPPRTGSLTITVPAGRTYKVTLLAFFTATFTDFASGEVMRETAVGHWIFTETAGMITFEVEVTFVQLVGGSHEVHYTMRRNGVNTGQTRGEHIGGSDPSAVAGHLLAIVEDIT